MTVHRDLHDKQLLVDGSGGIGLLDFDLAAAGEAALDLANLLVHLELRVHQGCARRLARRRRGTPSWRGTAPSRTCWLASRRTRRPPGHASWRCTASDPGRRPRRGGW
ncbi:phosphotransferase [Cellulomonas sp. ATA003]|uniref:phosphotransferase n=1 Tax=Cellulomonas sp. ATA003 TaxID=3073064 RepID=UPI0037C0ECB0